jgi:hypothetical protein
MTTSAVDQPRVVEVRVARRASERPLPRTPRERATHEPAREVERWLSPAPTSARMMNILEAEGGTKTAAWLAFPTIKLEVTILGDRRWRGAAGLHDENP